MEEDAMLYVQLHKLSVVKSEEDLEHILSILWGTRKTGVTITEKSYIQSLLNLPSIAGVDPVLACMRSLIIRRTHGNFTGEEFSQRFPPDLSVDLRASLLMLFEKYSNKWKEETSRERHLWPRTCLCNQVNSGLAPGFTFSVSSEFSSSLWPRHDDPATPFIAETDVSLSAPMPFQPKVVGDLGTLPRLKSMTWALENQNKTPSSRLVLITLKLQDYTKSSLGETEVKFRLTRDTLEAMLRSMTYINEQLSNKVGSSEASRKKQRQE